MAGRILVDIARHIGEYSPADILRLSTLALDVLAAALAHELDDDPTYLPPESRQRALWARIHTFIDQHLADPDLTPATIAAAHHISVSYLHKLFHNQGLTVAAMIRRRRLERIHRDLADPLLAARPIHAIAARWGFTSAAHFSRSFRTTFGLSPQQYRRTALPPARVCSNLQALSARVQRHAAIVGQAEPAADHEHGYHESRHDGQDGQDEGNGGRLLAGALLTTAPPQSVTTDGPWCGA